MSESIHLACPHCAAINACLPHASANIRNAANATFRCLLLIRWN